MNFLTMAQTVRQLVGMQGTGPDTVTTSNYDSIIVTLVKNAWEDIQISKKKWKWMRTTVNFSTIVDQTTYSVAQVFGPVFSRFGRWDKDFFFVTEGTTTTLLRFIDYDIWIRNNLNSNTERTNITCFTINPSDDSVIFQKPDKVYNITAYYYKSKQILATDSDIPELPSDYHNAIVYDAVARHAISISSGSVYQLYSQKFAELYDDLVRSQIPKEKLKVRGIV